MVAPVVPNQFEVGKNKIVHKPTKAAFSFDTGRTTFKSVNWGRACEQLSSGPEKRRRNAGCAAVAEQATKVDGTVARVLKGESPVRTPTLAVWCTASN